MLSPERRVPALRVALGPSRRLAVSLAVAHLGAAAAVTAADPGALWVAACCAILAISAWCAIRRYALLVHSRSVIAVELDGEDDCNVQRRTREWHHYRVRPSSHVAPWLIVLHLGQPGRAIGGRIVLVPDSMPADSYRRLLLRLRWSRSAAENLREDDRSL